MRHRLHTTSQTQLLQCVRTIGQVVLVRFRFFARQLEGHLRVFGSALDSSLLLGQSLNLGRDLPCLGCEDGWVEPRLAHQRDWLLVLPRWILILELLLILHLALFPRIVTPRPGLLPLSSSLPRLLHCQSVRLHLQLGHGLFRLRHDERLDVVLLLLAEVVFLCCPELVSLVVLEASLLLETHLLLDLPHALGYQLLLLEEELRLLLCFRGQLKRLLIVQLLNPILLTQLLHCRFFRLLVLEVRQEHIEVVYRFLDGVFREDVLLVQAGVALLVQRNSLLPLLDAHHLGDQLLSVLNLRVDPVLSDHLDILVQGLLVHVLDLPLQPFLLLVDAVEVVPHELVNVEVVISGALGSFSNSSTGLVLRVAPGHLGRLAAELVVLGVELVESVCGDWATLGRGDGASFRGSRSSRHQPPGRALRPVPAHLVVLVLDLVQALLLLTC